ncbi:MAG: biopolymer transporter ExbD [Muribaculaceae bacterium]|nr:biopolymer transporter ExbD [Muribaculaceae bacterium]
MGKVKPKRKSTLIDMTAMSDVTVLLLTFFMLTSTFLQKEPVTVITPSSVSEIKVPTSNVVTILVGTTEDRDGKEQGKIFLGIAGDEDPEMGGTEDVRRQALQIASQEYEKYTGKSTGITSSDLDKFAKLNMFGVPLADLHQFLSLKTEKQDEYLSDLENPNVGIPLKEIIYTNADGLRDVTNEFRIWMRAINNAGNANLSQAIKTGEGIAVKADATTNYQTMHEVLDNLQTMKMNRFSVMTALKSEQD